MKNLSVQMIEKLPEKMSPYSFANLLGVRPQYIYNMTREGKVLKAEVNDLGKQFLTKEVMTKFIQNKVKAAQEKKAEATV